MRPFSFINIFFLASIIAACSIPSIDDINLSQCTKPCNEAAKQCLNKQDERMAACKNDSQCSTNVGRAASACVTTCIDCINTCIEKLEHNLKN